MENADEGASLSGDDIMRMALKGVLPNDEILTNEPLQIRKASSRPNKRLLSYRRGKRLRRAATTAPKTVRICTVINDARGRPYMHVLRQIRMLREAVVEERTQAQCLYKVRHANLLHFHPEALNVFCPLLHNH